MTEYWKRVLLVIYVDGKESETGSQWAHKAMKAGYINIAVHEGGFRDWKEKHLPVAPLNNDLVNQR